MVNFKYH